MVYYDSSTMQFEIGDVWCVWVIERETDTKRFVESEFEERKESMWLMRLYLFVFVCCYVLNSELYLA